MEVLTKYCDDCDRVVRLTEDGYCKNCGKHADNMKSELINCTPNEIGNYIKWKSGVENTPT